MLLIQTYDVVSLMVVGVLILFMIIYYMEIQLPRWQQAADEHARLVKTYVKKMKKESDELWERSLLLEAEEEALTPIVKHMERVQELLEKLPLPPPRRAGAKWPYFFDRETVSR